MERRGHLEVLFEDAALALDAHDLGPLDEPVEVLLWQQGATDAELLRPLLEQRVHHLVFWNWMLSRCGCFIFPRYCSSSSITVSSRSTKTARGTCFPAPVSLKVLTLMKACSSSALGVDLEP